MRQLIKHLADPCSVWAMHPDHIAALVAALADDRRSPEAVARMESSMPGPYALGGQTATIPIVGMLVPGERDANWLRSWGEDATSYEAIKMAVEQAEADPRVAAVDFFTNSPGGYVTGIHEAAAVIAACSKPTRAIVPDSGQACSGALWLISQAKKIIAGEHADIGSIGAYTVLADVSGMLAKWGIRMDVVSSGGIKGQGADGRITDELRAMVQERINATAAEFAAAVAAGRKMPMEEATALATGHVWKAGEAMKRKLVDSVSMVGAKTAPPAVEAKPAAAHSTQGIAHMDALDLIAAHPKHAAMIAASAKAGKTADAIQAEIAAADHAAALADADAKAKAAEERAVAAEAKAKDAEAAKVKAESDLAALKALADGGKAGAKVKDEPGHALKATRAELDAMSPQERAKFYADGGVPV